ncbi:MAG: low specificity L-threonine aldolase [Alphaproteobacteria bacterium]|nr:MAG: low specificity L-threonine aldolase [Alphaproteobacteria bacterium]
MPDTSRLNFASDNAAPVLPEIMEALARANSGPARAYGNDPLTMKVEAKLKEIFECDLKAFPVATGTSANVLGLSVLTPPFGVVYCHRLAHIEEDECGAPEFYTGGAKLALMEGEMGKLSAGALRTKIRHAGQGVPHHAQPAAISITQASECGTLYRADEISAIGEVAKEFGLSLHMDGARFANAVASLNAAPAEITWKAGVDVLSFGATKNGAMAVEAVVFFDLEKAREFEFRRKRGAHLFSKMRYLSAQLDAYLANDLWLTTARKANAAAARLAEGINKIEGASLLYRPEANILFARLSQEVIARLAKTDIVYYPPSEAQPDVMRLVTSWDTREADVDLMLDVMTGKV